MYNTVVWVAEGFLALFFFVAGVPKVIGAVPRQWAGFGELPRRLTGLIGVAEVAAGVGLVAPAWSGVAEWLTPLAGLGIVLISLMGSGFHLRRREWPASLETALWASLAAAVVAARWDDFAAGPSISRHALLPVVLIVLIVAVIADLIVLSRVTVTQPSGPSAVADAGEAG